MFQSALKFKYLHQVQCLFFENCGENYVNTDFISWDYLMDEYVILTYAEKIAQIELGEEENRWYQ